MNTGRNMLWGLCAGLVVVAAGMQPAAASTFIPLQRGDLVRLSTVIVAGEVTEASSYWLTHPRVIMTGFKFRVEGVDKGTRVREGDVLQLRVLGGKVGKKRMVAHGFPTYVRGERCYLFLSVDANGAYQVIGGPQGKLDIQRDPLTGRDIIAGLPQQLADGGAGGPQVHTAGGPPPAFVDLYDSITGRLWLSEVRRAVRGLVDQEAGAASVPK